MGNFCSSCGKPITGRFCSHCGTVQQQSYYSSSDTQTDNYKTQQDDSLPQYRTKTTANEEINATIKILRRVCKVSTTLRTIAFILCVFFILPCFTIQFTIRGVYHGVPLENTSYYPYELINGVNFHGRNILNGSIFSLLLILTPVALFTIYHFYSNIQFIKGKLFVASTLLSIVGLLVNIVYVIIINSLAPDFLSVLPGYELAIYPFFYLAIFLYIMCIAISIKSHNKTMAYRTLDI